MEWVHGWGCRRPGGRGALERGGGGCVRGGRRRTQPQWLLLCEELRLVLCFPRGGERVRRAGLAVGRNGCGATATAMATVMVTVTVWSCSLLSRPGLPPRGISLQT